MSALDTVRSNWRILLLVVFVIASAVGGIPDIIREGLDGYLVPPHYDSLIAKLIVHGSNRDECLMRLRRALEEFVIGGIDTTLPLHRRLIEEPQFRSGDYDIHWLEKLMAF